jgi:3-deoxy-D-manno-octulosonic-acid transferase
LVRYDLFLDFLVWSFLPKTRLSWVWISFKKERSRGQEVSFIKRLFLKQSSLRVYAAEADREIGSKFKASGLVYDFRIEQIRRRVEMKQEKFAQVWPLYSEMKKRLDAIPRQQRFIFGNSWPSDLFLLQDLPSEVYLVIVPHLISQEIFVSMKEKLEGMGRKVEEVTDESTSWPLGKTIILRKKGILCELYQDFGKAYVGGGFETSIHSLLEPLVAGADHLACGPLHHRSTEFDLSRSYGLLTEVKGPEDLTNWLSLALPPEQQHDKMKTLISQYPEFQKEVLC